MTTTPGKKWELKTFGRKMDRTRVVTPHLPCVLPVSVRGALPASARAAEPNGSGILMDGGQEARPLARPQDLGCQALATNVRPGTHCLPYDKTAA